MSVLPSHHSTKRKERQFYQNNLPFMTEMERFACISFSLAGDGKSDKSIDQFLNWSMNMPPACSDMIRISPCFMKNTSPTLRQGMCFHGGDGEIRPARAPRRHAHGHRNMPPACFSRFARALFESLQPQIKKQIPHRWWEICFFGGDGEIRIMESGKIAVNSVSWKR